MSRSSLEPSDGEIRDAAATWVALLAKESYQDAWDELWHPADEFWTAELMEKSISSYGAPDDPPEEKYQVTNSPDVRVSITRVLEGIGGDCLAKVEVDLPLNGELSDLTATLEVVQMSESCCLKLLDIHVL